MWWVRGHGQSFRPFLVNGIGENQMVTEPSQWQHVAATENPADLCTRGATPDELRNNSLWWQGPKWLLSRDKASWPKMDVRGRPPTLPKIRTSNYMEGVEDVTSVLTCPLQKPKTEPMCDTWRLAPTRFSSWTHLVQLEARVWQVIYIMCDPKEKVSGLELL